MVTMDEMNKDNLKDRAFGLILRMLKASKFLEERETLGFKFIPYSFNGLNEFFS